MRWWWDAVRALVRGSCGGAGADVEGPRVHVVTSTFLDAERYRAFWRAWRWLALLLGVQGVQRLWVLYRGAHWSAYLDRAALLRPERGVPPELTVGWAAYKEDLLPLSVDLFLEQVRLKEAGEVEVDGADRRVAALLTPMGSSFVSIPNPVQHIPQDARPGRHLFREGDDTDVRSVQQLREVVAAEGGSDPPAPLQWNYQVREAVHRPWKSRFVDAERARGLHRLLPSLEWPDPPEDEGFSSDQEEQPGEFLRFKNADFVDEELPSLTRRGVTFASEKERTAYILQQVEEDRADIVRRALRRL